MRFEVVIINGKDYPVKYGFSALRVFTKLTNTTINDLGRLVDTMTLDHAICLCYAGLKDGHRVADKEFTLTIEDVADLLDDDNKALDKIMKVFSSSLAKPAKKKAKV